MGLAIDRGMGRAGRGDKDEGDNPRYGGPQPLVRPRRRRAKRGGHQRIREGARRNGSATRWSGRRAGGWGGAVGWGGGVLRQGRGARGRVAVAATRARAVRQGRRGARSGRGLGATLASWGLGDAVQEGWRGKGAGSNPPQRLGVWGPAAAAGHPPLSTPGRGWLEGRRCGVGGWGVRGRTRGARVTVAACWAVAAGGKRGCRLRGGERWASRVTRGRGAADRGAPRAPHPSWRHAEGGGGGGAALACTFFLVFFLSLLVSLSAAWTACSQWAAP